MLDSLVDLEYEKGLLAGVIQYPDVYLEVAPFIAPDDFTRYHSSIWTVIVSEIENKGTPAPLVLADKLISLGITFDGMEVFDYLESLRTFPMEKRYVAAYARQVRKLSLIRKIYNNAEKLKNRVKALKDEPVDEIVKTLDESLADSMMIFDSHECEAKNIYDGLKQFIEEKGNTPQEVGYNMPFRLWNDYYGGLRKGGLYFTASRSGQGKSTFLSYVGDSVANDCNPGKNIKVLFLDTEMDEDDQRIRLVAARVGCPFYLIDTGRWRESEEWFPKIRSGLDALAAQNRNMWFKQVASMGINDLVNFIKRWYFKHVGRDGNAFIVYDYLKVLANDSSDGQPEWQVALQKMQRLKDLAVELKAPIFTALQVTRAGTTTNRSSGEVVDDETVLSISGRIDWLVNFGAILRRKTPDEIAADGEAYGTHKLICLKARYQGRISQGHHDLVKISDKGKVRFSQNYLCFKIDNFKVEEVGDFREIAELKGWTKIKRNDGDSNSGF